MLVMFLFLCSFLTLAKCRGYILILFLFFTDYSLELNPGKQYGPFSTLANEVDCDSSSMFLSLLKSYIQASERSTHVLCWQRKTKKYLDILQKQFPSRLYLHDCLADSNGWIDLGKDNNFSKHSGNIVRIFY